MIPSGGILSAFRRGRPAADATPRSGLERLGIDATGWDFVVALAGNPNTGKSTVFNTVTGLRQHVGNWPGKTVSRAEGGSVFAGRRFKFVDLPGTYSLLTASTDEEIARDFILFGRPDCTVVVVDATILERNLNLVLQVLEITDRAVVCLNLMDEARRKKIRIDHQALSTLLGVPVVPTAARTGEGMEELMNAVAEVAGGSVRNRPHRIPLQGEVQDAVEELAAEVEKVAPGLPNSRWVAMRLLEGDTRVREALERGELEEIAAPRSNEGKVVGQTLETSAPRGSKSAATPAPGRPASERVFERAQRLRTGLDRSFRDQVVWAIYHEARTLTARVFDASARPALDWDARIDRILTSRLWGFPIMFLGLSAVFWITIVGANVPSRLLASLFFWFEGVAAGAFDSLGLPWWLTGFLWHGVYRGLAWVVSVMLPPMAIFFPLFTILENLGYLPRVAFNLDGLFRRVGAHGKQALTMSMGFGCNAAGVIACRVIESPRERLIAILTNNFVPCNGRFPTLIMLGTVFVAAQFPSGFASLAAAGSVVGVVLFGVFVTLLVSWLLSFTVLKGEASAFTLELPPYRRPNFGQILYTSIIDRTLFVLYRAVVMAAPAGGVIWILCNVQVGEISLASRIAEFLNPLGRTFGLDGFILLAYIIAIPANEIVVPTLLMTYTGAGALFELENLEQLRALLIDQQGWTLLTAICLMLFSVLHNPCSTTIWTIFKETGSVKWTALGTLLPLAVAFAVLFLVAQGLRFLGWS